MTKSGEDVVSDFGRFASQLRALAFPYLPNAVPTQDSCSSAETWRAGR